MSEDPAKPWWKSPGMRVGIGAGLGVAVPLLCLEFGGEGWGKVLCAVAQALLPFLPSLG